MLSAYVRRLDGEVFPVGWQHSGQHIGVDGEGSIRLARLYWDEEHATSVEMAGLERQVRARLLSTVPMLDVLILTRKSANGMERIVFHGLVQECGTDGRTVSLVAADNPKAQHLYDQPFTMDQELTPSDEKHPSDMPQPPADHTQQIPQPPQFAPVHSLAGFPGGSQVRTLGESSPVDPAARPGGRPAGGWVPSGARATADS